MITLKTAEEIQTMEKASRVVAETLQLLIQEVKPGMTTEDLDRLAEESICSRGGIPAFKGYLDFPKTLCASVNEQVVHGIPGKRTLRDGDIIGLDLGAIVDGFYGDSAVTVPVGEIHPRVRELLRVTEEALYKGIEQAVVGNRLSDISHAVQQHAESAGFSGRHGVCWPWYRDASCTKSHRFRTMESRDKGRGSSMGWSSRLNPW